MVAKASVPSRISGFLTDDENVELGFVAFGVAKSMVGAESFPLAIAG